MSRLKIFLIFNCIIIKLQICFVVVAEPVVDDITKFSDEKVLGGNNTFISPTNNTHKAYWDNVSMKILNNKLLYQKKKKTDTAKNIIFFLGDGMSIPTITAARIYQGQLKNKSGEEEKLFFETFPVVGLAKTYCVDAQVADSACTATAFMSGVKTNMQAIGVTAEVKNNDCESAKKPEMQLSTIIQWAQEAGKATGIVTNTRVTHATPAGAYAHVPLRHMESDADVIKHNLDPVTCNYDIASQLILQDPGKNIKVIMGGGRSKFLPKDRKDPISGFGERLDGVDLIEKWREDKINKNLTASIAYSKMDLLKVDVTETEYLLGLFDSSNMKYHLDSDPNIDPSLSLMTSKAIDILKKEKNGFVLFVEGGEIDFAHHSNLAHIAIDETLEFAKAVQVAAGKTSEKDTLIVVTADHSHTMSISGNPMRGTNIFEFAGMNSDNISYSTLSYANGPGYHPEFYGKRYNITQDKNITDPKYVYPAMSPLKAETHGGDDVAVFARGPWSHLFTGVYEQNFIPIAEALAADIGPFSKEQYISSSITINYNNLLFIIIITSNSILHLLIYS